eukprot:c19920_g2_i1.p1 GENE.c19920_g2_i1~~c19920_g2_i1.p1  ORF type:complete len:275 (+),score=32.87 c19920_g2_i1:215-1039(+)
MEGFFQPEQLHGQNAFTCETCKHKRSHTKKFVISTLPQVLCVHLKRFSHTSATARKLSGQVAFPMVLDVARYSELSSPKAPQNFDRSRLSDHNNANEPKNHRSCLYDLFGVVVHHGAFQGGHYVSVVRRSHQWYECNDSIVKKFPETAVGSLQAYILFYRRRSIQPSDEREIRLPLIQVSAALLHRHRARKDARSNPFRVCKHGVAAPSSDGSEYVYMRPASLRAVYPGPPPVPGPCFTCAKVHNQVRDEAMSRLITNQLHDTSPANRRTHGPP